MEKRIRKLTPLLLKKIINEEKQKLNVVEKKKSKSKPKPKPKPKAKKKLSEVAKLRLMKKRQIALFNEIKKIQLARKKIKKALIERL